MGKLLQRPSRERAIEIFTNPTRANREERLTICFFAANAVTKHIRGLRHQDRADTGHDIFAHLARNLDKFHFDPAISSDPVTLLYRAGRNAWLDRKRVERPRFDNLAAMKVAGEAKVLAADVAAAPAAYHRKHPAPKTVKGAIQLLDRRIQRLRREVGRAEADMRGRLMFALMILQQFRRRLRGRYKTLAIPGAGRWTKRRWIVEGEPVSKG